MTMQAISLLRQLLGLEPMPEDAPPEPEPPEPEPPPPEPPPPEPPAPEPPAPEPPAPEPQAAAPAPARAPAQTRTQGGYSGEAINRMSPEEYERHRPAIQAEQLERLRRNTDYARD